MSIFENILYVLFLQNLKSVVNVLQKTTLVQKIKSDWLYVYNFTLQVAVIFLTSPADNFTEQ